MKRLIVAAALILPLSASGEFWSGNTLKQHLDIAALAAREPT